MNSQESLSYKEKSVVVAGGSQGIGRALALWFAEHDATVYVLYHKNKKAAMEMKQLTKVVKKKLSLIRVDLTHPAQVKRAFQRIQKKEKGIDVLLHTTGNFFQKPLEAITPQEFHSCIASNLLSAQYVFSSAIPLMKKNSVMITFGFHDVKQSKPFVNIVPYAIAKQGLLTLTKSYAKALAPKKIRVHMIAPGFMFNDTSSLGDAQNIPFQRKADYTDIINVVRFLIAEESEYLTGQTIIVDGGYHL